MSRIGKNPVSVPDGVDVQIAGQDVTVKGKLGELSLRLVPEVSIEQRDKSLVFRPVDDSKDARRMWGLSRSLVDNLVVGVSEGFTINLEIQGVGYRAAVQGNLLNLDLGYSHQIRYSIPDGIKITCEKPVSIRVHGANRQQVGQVAAEIRGFRKPEPYKGKGIRYEGEYVRRKEGKKK
jgi:large subunit ribosomal protein L6